MAENDELSSEDVVAYEDGYEGRADREEEGVLMEEREAAEAARRAMLQAAGGEIRQRAGDEDMDAERRYSLYGRRPAPARRKAKRGAAHAVQALMMARKHVNFR